MKKLLFVIVLSIASTLAFGQCNFRYGANEEDSLKCLEDVNSFRVFYNNKQYADAYVPWQEVVKNCPCAWDGIYTYAQNMFDNLIKAETDSAKKEALVDQLIDSYRNRHLYFPKKYTEGNGLGFMAYNAYRYRIKNYMKNKEYDKIEDIYNMYVRSVELEKDATQPNIWDTYFIVAEIMTQVKKDTNIIIEAYERNKELIK